MKQHSIQRHALILICLVFGLLASGSVFAQFGMPRCEVKTTDVNFGDYLSQVVTATGTFTVECNNPQPQNIIYARVCIGLMAGGGGGTVNSRRMSSGSNTLNYQLYRSPSTASNQIWGTGTQQVEVESGPIPPLSGYIVVGTLTVYGRIAGAQNAAPGLYTSTYPSPDQVDYRYKLATDGPPLPGDCGPPLNTMLGVGTFAAFTVRANVPQGGSCQIVTLPTQLNFGTVTATANGAIAQIGPPGNPRSRISLQCTANLPYTIKLDNGLHSTLSGQRRMRRETSPAAFVRYEIYKETQRINRWGSTGAEIKEVPGSTQSLQIHDAYGQVPAQQGEPPRESRRLQPLREWSHEQTDIEQIFP